MRIQIKLLNYRGGSVIEFMGDYTAGLHANVLTCTRKNQGTFIYFLFRSNGLGVIGLFSI